MDFNKLKEQFQEDVKISEEMIEKQIISLPKIMAKYINAYNDILNSINEISTNKDKLYHLFMLEYRGGKSDLSSFTWSATELKKMIETSPRFVELTKEEMKFTTELKTVEEMIATIKGMGFSINNYLTYKKIINGS